jgi:pyruvate dehydrogenase E1 component alpha subunit
MTTEVATSSARHDLLPSADPIQLVGPSEGSATARPDFPMPSSRRLVEAYRAMVVGRRFDTQATALTKQGRLAVYPSSRGQEACQIAASLSLRETDWLFPTYRDSVALVSRGIDPVDALTLLRGNWHCGYDPKAVRTAPQCTPLATQALHAVGLAHGEARRGRDTVALVLIGDGATSEGDFHEALNFAAVFRAPVVFFVQNNGYAISVPLAKQSAAPSLAHKGVGYGVRGERVDGNDVAAVLSVLDRAVGHARSGAGPFLVEAHTYRVEPHTNADDATRYREQDEVESWKDRDPVSRVERYLRSEGLLDDAHVEQFAAEADAQAADLRTRMQADPEVHPLELFEHVYAEPTPQLSEQRAQVVAEQAAETASGEEASR